MCITLYYIIFLFTLHCQLKIYFLYKVKMLLLIFEHQPYKSWQEYATVSVYCLEIFSTCHSFILKNLEKTQWNDQLTTSWLLKHPTLQYLNVFFQDHSMSLATSLAQLASFGQLSTALLLRHACVLEFLTLWRQLCWRTWCFFAFHSWQDWTMTSLPKYFKCGTWALLS